MRMPAMETPILWLAAASTVIAGHTSCGAFQWDDIEYLLAFGDSYTYVQGELGYPGYSFIGDYRPGHLAFTPEELLSNRIIQNFNGTSAGGPNWIEFLSGCAVDNGAWLPSECDIQLWDFAFAGADYSLEYLPLHHNYSVQMVNQTQQYLKWAEPVIGKTMDKSKALVAVWIGINDIGDAAALEKPLPGFFDDIITAMFDQTVQWMYDAGFRNLLFLNIPPRERSPYYAGDAEAVAEVKQHIEWWNDILRERSTQFTRAHKEANVLLYDTYTVLNAVLESPNEYGFLNTTDYCPGYDQEEVLTNPEKFGCTPLDTYFWYDSGHISSHAHRILAQDLNDFLQDWSREK